MFPLKFYASQRKVIYISYHNSYNIAIKINTLLKFNFLPITIITFLTYVTSAMCGELVIIQSAPLEPYNQAVRGIEDILAQDIPTRGPKAITAHTIHSFILSKNENLGQLRKEIQEQQPDILLVIGSSSLSFAKGIQKTPIIYLMVPFPELITGAQNNITGIDMNIAPDRELDQLTQVAPQAKNIGILYDPNRTGSFVQKTLEYASQKKLTIIALPIRQASDVPWGLTNLKGRIDWLWMIPDLTVLTPQTVDIIMLFSLENRVPILTFSEKYLDLGAVLSVSTDPYDMGRQAAELALQVMENPHISGQPPTRVRKVKILTNPQAAQMLGIELHETGSGEGRK